MTWWTWDLPIYIGAIAFLVFFAKMLPEFDKAFALLVAAIVFTFAAFRRGGFDYEQNLAMVRIIRSADVSSLSSAITLAKDPFFGAVTFFVGWVRDDPVWVLYANVLIAVATKTLFALQFRRRSTIFLGTYGIFLAPGLEFAAIRTAVGLGFLALAIQSTRRPGTRYVLAIVSGLSHISLVPAIGFSFLTRRLRSAYRPAFFAGVVGVAFLAFGFISDLPFQRAADYVSDRGTVYAFFPPLVTLTILILSVPNKVQTFNPDGIIPTRNVFDTSLALIATALGAAPQVVTASTRFLELACFLMMVLFIQIDFKLAPRRVWLGYGAFLFWLAVANVYRGTWSIFNDFGVVGH